jgi:glutamine amidotransferase
MIAIIDYGLGNPESVKNMLRKAGADALITADHQQLAEAEKLILPGVGAFGKGMENLRNAQLDSLIKARTAAGVKLLGICLGAQLLTEHSEENNCAGLGLIFAETVKFTALPAQLKVPRMGWNEIEVRQNHALFNNTAANQRYYFVHSYFMRCKQPEDILCLANYGTPFAAGIAKNNVAGVQFHPEKSHVFGLALMKNFIAW